MIFSHTSLCMNRLWRQSPQCWKPRNEKHNVQTTWGHFILQEKKRSISLQTNADTYSQEETLSGVPLRRTRSVCTLYSQCTSTRILTLVLPTALKTWQETGSVKKEWSAVVTNKLSLAPSSRTPPFAHLTSQQNWTDVKSAVKSTEKSVFVVFPWGIQAWNIMNVFTLSIKVFGPTLTNSYSISKTWRANSVSLLLCNLLYFIFTDL